ncbi:MAG: uL15 family ribosomal protein [Candidatus Aenigmarchaeota archaeon]|nr:uL15 family ribosomal protein [Candidatus Aenigmarchaeota archaeon]
MGKKKVKKVRKLRGSKTHGYGSKKKHRGKGSRGGRGYAGSSKHRRSYIVKYEKNHFYHKKLKPKRKLKTINVSDLGELLREGQKKINLIELGYEKLLGSGTAPKEIVVVVGKCTAKAREKIESAGGKVIIAEKTSRKKQEKNPTEEAAGKEFEKSE